MEGAQILSAREQHLNRYLNFFVDHVRDLNELDYGDFMREANAYLLTLREACKNEDKSVHDKIDEMQLYTQFYPSWEIEPTRARLLQDAKRLRDLMDHGPRSSHSGPHSPF